MILSCAQIRMARVALRLSVEQLHAISGVSVSTIRRLEQPERPTGAHVASIERLQCALESQGITFLVDDGVNGAGLRYREQIHTTDPLKVI